MNGIQLDRHWKVPRLLESRELGLTTAEMSVELKVLIWRVYRHLGEFCEKCSQRPLLDIPLQC